jgi:hypothetical protein
MFDCHNFCAEATLRLVPDIYILINNTFYILSFYMSNEIFITIATLFFSSFIVHDLVFLTDQKQPIHSLINYEGSLSDPCLDQSVAH